MRPSRSTRGLFGLILSGLISLPVCGLSAIRAVGFGEARAGPWAGPWPTAWLTDRQLA